MDITNITDITVPLKRQTGTDDLDLPAYATEHSAGMDLVANVKGEETLKPGAFAVIPTGISIALPAGHEAQVRPRSGLAAKYGVTVLNSPGTIDADYRGEIGVILINHGPRPFVIKRGMRIAQMIIAAHARISWVECDSLEESARGAGGFGSTGTSSAGGNLNGSAGSNLSGDAKDKLDDTSRKIRK